MLKKHKYIMISEKAIKDLQFKEILISLSQCAILSDAEKLALETKPESSYEKAVKELSYTAYCSELMHIFGTPFLSKVENSNSALLKASKGGILSIKQLRNISFILKNFRSLDLWKKQIDINDNSIKFLEIFNLYVNKNIEDKLNTSIESDDQLFDNASKTLFEIRTKLKNNQNKIKINLDNIIHSSQYSKYLQEMLITTRNGRYVIPVKAEYKSEIKGLIHDTSSSGSTYFIEPISVLELNNEINELIKKDEQEVERIITELSLIVGSIADEIISSYQNMISIDLYFAKAKYADKINAKMPILIKTGASVIKNAKHPLIDNKKVVPINIFFNDGVDSIIITGPNTGGKTVSIKTFGLLTLMAQSGLFILAEENSKVRFYEDIFTDIGDEQSIEQSLSTFSAHMKNIVNIKKYSSNNSLILLDEICSGTDPIEGAALAISIIEEFRNNGSNVIATTHYSELKLYALDTPGVENASCEFDVKSLKPTYKLIIGIPGKSNAFEISRRLGLDNNIIENAEKLVTNKDRNFEDIISNLNKTRIDLEEKLKEAESNKIKTEKLLQEANNKIQNINKSKDSEIDKANKKAQKIVDETREKTQKIIEELENIKKEKDAEQFSKLLSNSKYNTNKTLNNLENEVNPIEEAKIINTIPLKINVGDIVFVKSLNKEVIISKVVGNNKYEIQSGFIKSIININDIIENKGKAKQIKGKVNKKGIVSNSERKINMELDLRGMDAEQAIMELKQFIDKSVLSNINLLRIIHGKGTGILRTSVSQYLKSNKFVKSYRLGAYGEGEDGVTIVELK